MKVILPESGTIPIKDVKVGECFFYRKDDITLRMRIWASGTGFHAVDFAGGLYTTLANGPKGMEQPVYPANAHVVVTE